MTTKAGFSITGALPFISCSSIGLVENDKWDDQAFMREQDVRHSRLKSREKAKVFTDWNLNVSFLCPLLSP